MFKKKPLKEQISVRMQDSQKTGFIGNDNSMSIREFLLTNPSFQDILEFVDRKALIIANQKKKERLQQVNQNEFSPVSVTLAQDMTKKQEAPACDPFSRVSWVVHVGI